MTDPFEQHRKLTEKIRSFKYPLYPLGKIAEIKRRPTTTKKLQHIQNEEALMIEKSRFENYSTVAIPCRERISTKKRFLVYRNEICVYDRDPANSLICPDDLCITNRGYFVIKPKENLFPEYLLVLFKSDCLNEQIVSKGRGRNPALGIGGAKEIKIPLPPLKIQKEIRKIWNREKEKQEQLLLKEKELVDLFERLEYFLGVAGDNPNKAESGIFSTQELLSLLDNWSPVYVVACESREESGQMSFVSHIPLRKIADITVGASVPREFRSTGLAFYGCGNVLKGYLSGSPLAYIPEKYVGTKINRNAVVQNGDIMVCVNGRKSLGKAAIYNGEQAIISQSLVRIRLKDEYNNKLNRLLIAAYFNTTHAHEKMFIKGRGSKNKYVRLVDLEEILVPNFFCLHQNQIVAILEKYEKTAKELVAQEQKIRPDGEVAKECVQQYLI